MAAKSVLVSMFKYCPFLDKEGGSVPPFSRHNPRRDLVCSNINW